MQHRIDLGVVTTKNGGTPTRGVPGPTNAVNVVGHGVAFVWLVVQLILCSDDPVGSVPLRREAHSQRPIQVARISMQHRLYFFPLPQGHGALRPTFIREYGTTRPRFRDDPTSMFSSSRSNSHGPVSFVTS